MSIITSKRKVNEKFQKKKKMKNKEMILIKTLYMKLKTDVIVFWVLNYFFSLKDIKENYLCSLENLLYNVPKTRFKKK